MADPAPTILLVDDEDAVRKVLAFPLERDGYEVIQAADGEEALTQFAAQPVDLVVLDIMLPRLDGLEVCKRLRATSTVPIIMLTARDDELDKVIGLELGADDYITKPFSIREFRSRVRALLRRARAPHAALDVVEEVIEHEGLRIDVPRRIVEVRGEPVQLTYVEFELLRTLAAYPGRVFSRRMLLEALWKSADYRDPRTIDVHVRHLREKLEAEPRDARVHPDGTRRRLPLPRQVMPVPERRRPARARAPRRRGRRPGDRLPDRRALLPLVPGVERAAGARALAAHDRDPELSRGVVPEAGLHRGVGLARERPHRRLRPAELRAGTARAGRRLGLGDRLERRRERSGRLRGDQGLTLAPRHRHPQRPDATPRWPYPLGGSGRAALGVAARPAQVVAVVRRRSSSPARWPCLRRPARVRGCDAFARRIRRLELAADRIAAGRFDEPVVDHGSDEVGQLARSFERMRLRLAHLDRARGEFIANASHELRTPLFSLGGFLELLDDPGARRETRATSSSPRCASRSTGSRSSRPTCSTSRASTPGG